MLSDLSALSGLTNLRELNLAYQREITDLSALSSLTNLEKLHLGCYKYPYGDNGIRDISALSGLTNLRQLNLDNNRISDLSALSEMNHLETLSLEHNGVLKLILPFLTSGTASPQQESSAALSTISLSRILTTFARA